MAIIGGIQSFTGALIVATVITILNELMRQGEIGTSWNGVDTDSSEATGRTAGEAGSRDGESQYDSITSRR